MNKKILAKYLAVAAGAVILVVGFNNCGEGFIAEQIGSSSGGSVFFSRAPGQSCEDALLRVYQSTYHPFLSQTCNNCHISGPGIGTFASPDVKTSYDSFASVGADKISNQAVNDSHKPPYTGSQNTARINELRSSWGAAQTGYASCLASSGGGTSIGLVVHANGKTVPAGLGTTNFVRMEWDLETMSSAKVPLIAGIEIRLGAVGGVTRGYEYRNPTLRLKTAAAGSYRARSLTIFVNEALQSEVTTYANIDSVVSAITDLNLSPGTANAFNTRTVAATDLIGVEFASLGSTTGVANPGGGATPVPTATPPTAVLTFTQLTAANGIFTNNCISCHSGANARGSLDLTSYAAAKAAAANIRFRVNNAGNPMPTSGLLLSEIRDQINAWVDAGAPQ